MIKKMYLTIEDRDVEIVMTKNVKMIGDKLSLRNMNDMEYSIYYTSCLKPLASKLKKAYYSKNSVSVIARIKDGKIVEYAEVDVDKEVHVNHLASFFKEPGTIDVYKNYFHAFIKHDYHAVEIKINGYMFHGNLEEYKNTYDDMKSVFSIHNIIKRPHLDIWVHDFQNYEVRRLKLAGRW